MMTVSAVPFVYLVMMLSVSGHGVLCSIVDSKIRDIYLDGDVNSKGQEPEAGVTNTIVSEQAVPTNNPKTMTTNVIKPTLTAPEVNVESGIVNLTPTTEVIDNDNRPYLQNNTENSQVTATGPTRDNIGGNRTNTVTTIAPRLRKASLVRKLKRKHRKQEGAVRLVNGSGDYEGNVEVFHNGSWGSICDDEWDTREAEVVCRQLGFKEGALKPTHGSQYGQPTNKFLMDNLYCEGDEKRVVDCRFDGWGLNDCSASEAAGVVCNDRLLLTTTVTPSPPPLGRTKPKFRISGHSKGFKLRLVGGRLPTEGRVEVRTENSEWGNICGDGWSLLEAGVVCKHLEFGYALAAAQNNYFAGKVSRIVMSGVECRGNESTLEECSSHLGPLIECPGIADDNIAGVICTKVLADLIIDADEIQRTAYLEDRQLYFLQCAMEENCVASSAYQLVAQQDSSWHLETRRLLRFTAKITNIGTDQFRPHIPKHLWEFHQCHMHYHSMEVFATFDVLSGGRRVAEGHKASFCLEDNVCSHGVTPKFACANYGDQGISVNCSDIYKHNIDCQWVDISDLEPGNYLFKVAINPEFKVPEMSFENNAALCRMVYSNYGVHLSDCRIIRP